MNDTLPCVGGVISGENQCEVLDEVPTMRYTSGLGMSLFD